MMDPDCMTLVDALESVARLRIVPRLALEVRVAESLERLYGLAVDDRLARTRSRIARHLALRSLLPAAFPAGESA